MKSDWLVISLLTIAFAFAMALAGADVALWTLHVISRWLMALPAPTDTWADIVKAFAWPLVLFYFLSRYRGHVRRVLDTIAERLRTDKWVKLGPFELTADAEVIALDPKQSGDSTERYSPDDVGRMERMLEFISEPDSFLKLISWVEQNVTPTVNIGDFLTESPYATQREQAYRALIEGGQR